MIMSKVTQREAEIWDSIGVSLALRELEQSSSSQEEIFTCFDLYVL
jgi:hypothetical protein